MGRSFQQTKQKLRHAVVTEAVAKGIGSVSVAGVVRRARVSAGTVYVHYQSKEHLIREVYMDVKHAFHAMIMSAGQLGDTRAMVRKMWFDMFAFVSARPAEFLFLEYGSTAKILTPEQEQTSEKMREEIGELLQRGIDDGTLAPLDRTVLTLLLVAPAMQLARQLIHHGQPATDELVETMYARVWRAIANDDIPKEKNKT